MHAHRAAAGDQRIGPVALAAEVHLVAAAHRAQVHEVHAAADQERRIRPRRAEKDVVAETVLAFRARVPPWARPPQLTIL